jgi:hypothetical protein
VEIALGLSLMIEILTGILFLEFDQTKDLYQYRLWQLLIIIRFNSVMKSKTKARNFILSNTII